MLIPVRQTDRQGANSSSTSLHNIKGLVLSRETSQVITFTKSMLTVSIDIDHCLSACLPIHATLYYMISEVLTPKEDELLSYRLSKLMFQRSLWWGTLKNQFSSFFFLRNPPKSLIRKWDLLFITTWHNKIQGNQLKTKCVVNPF